MATLTTIGSVKWKALPLSISPPGVGAGSDKDQAMHLPIGCAIILEIDALGYGAKMVTVLLVVH